MFTSGVFLLDQALRRTGMALDRVQTLLLQELTELLSVGFLSPLERQIRLVSDRTLPAAWMDNFSLQQLVELPLNRISLLLKFRVAPLVWRIGPSVYRRRIGLSSNFLLWLGVGCLSHSWGLDVIIVRYFDIGVFTR